MLFPQMLWAISNDFYYSCGKLLCNSDFCAKLHMATGNQIGDESMAVEMKALLEEGQAPSETTNFVAIVALAKMLDVPYTTIIYHIERLGFKKRKFPLDRSRYITLEEARTIQRLREDALARQQNTV